MDVFRPSKLDAIDKCLGYAAPCLNPIEEKNDAAGLGTAAHEILRAWAALDFDGDPPIERVLATLPDAASIDKKELTFLVNECDRMRRRIGEFASDWRPEVQWKVGPLSGTIDLLGVDVDVDGRTRSLIVLDYKTGRVEEPKEHQLRAYAWAAIAMFGFPTSGYVYAAELWARTGHIFERRWTSESINAWASRLAHTAAKIEAGEFTFTPGSHCRFCRRVHECSARVSYEHAAVQALVAKPFDQIQVNLGDLWEKSRAVKAALDRYEKAVDAALDEHGQIVCEGGVLSRDTRTKTEIKTREAWPILKTHLSTEQLAAATSISKGKVTDAISEAAPRGQKKQAVADIMAELEAAGAIEQSTYNVKVYKAKEPTT